MLPFSPRNTACLPQSSSVLPCVLWMLSGGLLWGLYEAEEPRKSLRTIRIILRKEPGDYVVQSHYFQVDIQESEGGTDLSEAT